MGHSATPTKNGRPGPSTAPLGRIPGGLRKPAMVAARDYDEQGIELAALRHDANCAHDPEGWAEPSRFPDWLRVLFLAVGLLVGGYVLLALIGAL